MPGLGVDRRVVDVRLELGERVERAHAELGPEEHRLQARDDRVAAEDRHEPGHTRCGHHPRTLAVAESQRREVGDGLVEGMAELVPGGLEPRQAQRPGVERLADARALRAEPLLHERGMGDLPVERHRDVHADVPRAVRGERDREPDDTVARLAAAREHDLRPPTPAVGLLQHHAAGLLVEAPRRGRGQLGRMERVAEREVVLLHADDVREVRPKSSSSVKEIGARVSLRSTM